MTDDYVARPEKVGESEGPDTVYVGYPIDGGVHLLSEREDASSHEGDFVVDVKLDREQVKGLKGELKKWGKNTEEDFRKAND